MSLTGWLCPRLPNLSLYVLHPAARASSWFPKQMPKMGTSCPTSHAAPPPPQPPPPQPATASGSTTAGGDPPFLCRAAAQPVPTFAAAAQSEVAVGQRGGGGGCLLDGPAQVVDRLLAHGGIAGAVGDEEPVVALLLDVPVPRHNRQLTTPGAHAGRAHVSDPG